jgi:hypothetical protein
MTEKIFYSFGQSGEEMEKLCGAAALPDGFLGKIA